MITTNQNIEGLDICNYSFLYSPYADSTTLFLENLKSVMELPDTVCYFSNYFRLNSSISKCEIACVATLKEIYVAGCVLKSDDLTSDIMKILLDTFKNHKSVQRIKLANFQTYSTLNFSKVTESNVRKKIMNSSTKKTTKNGDIPSKILKKSVDIYIKEIAFIINNCIENEFSLIFFN